MEERQSLGLHANAGTRAQEGTCPGLAPLAGRTVQVLFRGPRLKAGIDVGPAHATVSPVTGRMTYR